MNTPHDVPARTRLDTAPAAERIDQFLKDHRKGTLFVAVGYASVYGLEWLAERTRGRQVTLLIGNAQPSRFKKGSDAQRAAALDFVRRPDVQVKNWYRTGRAGGVASDAHLKVWAVCDRHDVVTAALVGSANLSKSGLYQNVEVCVEASGKDLTKVVQQIKPLFDEAWDYGPKLIGYLESGASPSWKGRRELGREASGDQPDTRAGSLVRALTWPFRVLRTAASVLLKVFVVVGIIAVVGLVTIVVVGIVRGWFG